MAEVQHLSVTIVSIMSKYNAVIFAVKRFMLDQNGSLSMSKIKDISISQILEDDKTMQSFKMRHKGSWTRLETRQ
jgi:hypothetical protein